MTIALWAAAALAALLAATDARAQTETPCPASLPSGTVCHAGREASGAYYWIARPAKWNGVLIVHAHGGPRLPAPKPDSPIEDLSRFAVMVKEGFAWAGSSFRRGGYGVTMAAEDTESVRRVYVQAFGAPRRTILHGQSWGGLVAARTAELFSGRTDGREHYDAALLTSGVLAGNTRAYNFRADLRAVYQHYCQNHPRPDEPPYPFWMGLPADSPLTSKELEARVTECTGLPRPPEQRTEAQRRSLTNILNVLRIPEQGLMGHLSWSTFHFRDLVQLRLGGKNPFSNVGVRYAGSDDDEALNRSVVRFAADPEALVAFARDGDLTGKGSIPVLTMHAIDDPIAFVEHEATFRETLERAGTADRLVQTFTRESEHSYLSTPQYATLLEALARWIETGTKPTPRGIAELCEKHRATHGGGCHFDPSYQPKPLDSRQYPRAMRP